MSLIYRARTTGRACSRIADRASVSFSAFLVRHERRLVAVAFAFMIASGLAAGLQFGRELDFHAVP